MANSTDYLLQDSEAALVSVNANRAALTEKGFSDAAYNDLVNARSGLKSAELAQQKAVKLVERKTAEQDAVITGITELIRKVRNAARSAYENDPQKLSQFKIGEKIPDTVKKLRTTCEYIASVVDEKKADLLQSGLVQEDVDELNTASDRLAAADAEQEAAKKTQVSATLSRDAAEKLLKKKLTKLRNFVKSAFANKPEMLVQFTPIPKGRGKGGPGDDENTPPPPDEPTPPAG